MKKFYCTEKNNKSEITLTTVNRQLITQKVASGIFLRFFEINT